MEALRLYKLVERTPHGKVVQIYEVYRKDIERYTMPCLDRGNTVTITELKK